MKITVSFATAFWAGFSLFSALADVKLPAILSDHMVLKKAAKVPIWGTADPDETVTVTMNQHSVKATAGADGKWATALDLQNEKEGPFTMSIDGKNHLKIQDVVVGEVWIASGQSNMTFSLGTAIEASAEIALPPNPMLRQYRIERAPVPEPQNDTLGKWQTATPGTIPGFSAVGYFFGKTLHTQLNVPVGLINVNWGGTPAESWTSAEALATVPDLKDGAERIRQKFTDYTSAKAKFVTDFGKWLADNKREDKPADDVSTFAAPEASTKDWVAVKVPGIITGQGLPENGVVWLRTEVTLPAGNSGGQALRLELGPVDGFDSVYWNGEKIGETTWQDYPGQGFGRLYNVPAAKVKAGREHRRDTHLCPGRRNQIPIPPKLGGVVVKEGWLAKTESELPPLAPADLAAVPKPPATFAGPQMVASFLYNGMIHPLIPYALSGVIWYQGEENTPRAFQYRTTLPLLIGDWRSRWNQGDFPFYVCQLANFQAKQSVPDESKWAELREAQSMVLKLPNTGRAVLIDLGDSGNIHPRHKKPVGERLAQIALAAKLWQNGSLYRTRVPIDDGGERKDPPQV